MRVSSIRWGLIWIGTGLLFLAINLELLDTLVFPRLFSLWPVLPIAIGVEMVFRRTRYYFLALLSPLLIAAAFIFAAYAQGDWGWDSDGFLRRWVWQAGNRKLDTMEIPADSAVDALELDLECGSSDIVLKPLSGRIFEARTEYYHRAPRLEHEIKDGIEKISYTSRERTRLAIFGFNIAASRNYIAIADFLPIDARMTALEEESLLDFSKMMLRSLDLNIRSDVTDLRIGDRVDTVTASISGNASQLRLSVPGDYGLIIYGDSATVGHLLAYTEMYWDGDGFYFPGFEENRKQIRLGLTADVKSIILKRLPVAQMAAGNTP
jgi:hypothetical protein